MLPTRSNNLSQFDESSRKKEKTSIYQDNDSHEVGEGLVEGTLLLDVENEGRSEHEVQDHERTHLGVVEKGILVRTPKVLRHKGDDENQQNQDKLARWLFEERCHMAMAT